MDDQKLANLELELGRLQPVPVPKALRDRIAGQLKNEDLTFGDRIFVFYSFLGSLAACFIVGIAVWQFSIQSPASYSTVDNDLAHTHLIAEYRELLAVR